MAGSKYRGYIRTGAEATDGRVTDGEEGELNCYPAPPRVRKHQTLRDYQDSAYLENVI